MKSSTSLQTYRAYMKAKTAMRVKFLRIEHYIDAAKFCNSFKPLLKHEFVELAEFYSERLKKQIEKVKMFESVYHFGRTY